MSPAQVSDFIGGHIGVSELSDFICGHIVVMECSFYICDKTLIPAVSCTELWDEEGFLRVIQQNIHMLHVS